MPTSKLQRYTGDLLRKTFYEYEVKENCRPDWLLSGDGGRLELDFFIDELSLAVEVQGRQHLQFIPYFHEYEQAFIEQQQRDREKARLCHDIGINLFYIFDKQDASSLMTMFKIELEQRRKHIGVKRKSFQELAANKDRFRYHLNRLCSFVVSSEQGCPPSEKGWVKLSKSLRIVVVGIDQCGLDLPGKEERHPRKMELIDKAIELLARYEYDKQAKRAQ